MSFRVYALSGLCTFGFMHFRFMHFRVYALLVYALSSRLIHCYRDYSPLSPRPSPAVASTCPRCRLDLSPLSSRPVPAVASTCPRCRLDLSPLSSRPQGEILNLPRTIPRSEQQDFSLRFEMTAGVTLHPSPYREHFSPLHPLSPGPTPAVASTYPRCHLDLPPLSSRPQGEILNLPRNIPRREQQDFSLRFEMTAGVTSWPSPYREQRDFSLRFEMTAGVTSHPSPYREQRTLS